MANKKELISRNFFSFHLKFREKILIYYHFSPIAISFYVILILFIIYAYFTSTINWIIFIKCTLTQNNLIISK